MDIKQIMTDSCATIFDVDGVKLRLWIITGGQPALSFEDYSFSERYDITDKRWAINHKDWEKNHRYPHQINQNPIQGPNFDVLPNGIKSVQEFLDKNVPLRDLRKERLDMLPIYGTITSKGFRDRDNRTIVRFDINVEYHRVSPLTASSKVYCGRCDDAIDKYAPKEFKRYAEFVNPLFDALNFKNLTLDELTEDQFQELVLIMADVKKYVEKHNG